MSEIYYRLREQLLYDSEMKIVADKYVLIKRTPKGVWVTAIENGQGKKRFVLDGKGRRFAYTAMKEAIISFKKRKRRQILILESQLTIAKAALNGIIDEEFKVGRSFEDETLSIFTEY